MGLGCTCRTRDCRSIRDRLWFDGSNIVDGSASKEPVLLDIVVGELVVGRPAVNHINHIAVSLDLTWKEIVIASAVVGFDTKVSTEEKKKKSC